MTGAISRSRRPAASSSAPTKATPISAPMCPGCWRLHRHREDHSEGSHLAVFIRMLSRSALARRYAMRFRIPARRGRWPASHRARRQRTFATPRHEGFWYSLKCIRCGACMNTCPVYRRSGGLSYGATYSGPIGIIIDPAFDIRKYSNLPYASTLNGSCTNVCPVKINIHEQIYKWRQVMAERNRAAAGQEGGDPRHRQGDERAPPLSRGDIGDGARYRAPAALCDL